MWEEEFVVLRCVAALVLVSVSDEPRQLSDGLTDAPSKRRSSNKNLTCPPLGSVGRTRATHAKTTWDPRPSSAAKNLVSQNCPPRVPAAINTPSFFFFSRVSGRPRISLLMIPFFFHFASGHIWLRNGIRKREITSVSNRCQTAATHLLHTPSWFNSGEGH